MIQPTPYPLGPGPYSPQSCSRCHGFTWYLWYNARNQHLYLECPDCGQSAPAYVCHTPHPPIEVLPTGPSASPPD